MQPNQLPLQPASPQPTGGLDPQAVNLAKAIRQTESGGNFQARGKSGEYGAYQYTDPTWGKDSAAAGVNVPLEQATPEQQNEVAYKKIKALKDAGYNVGEIASIWNSGDPQAYLSGKTGVNKYGVKYDVPAYAKSVATAYQTIKNGGHVGVDANNPSSVGSQPQQAPEASLGSELQGRLSDAGTALTQAAQGKINPLSGILQAAGAGAGAIGDVTNKALELIPGVSQLEGLLGKGVSAAANTGIGKAITGGWNSFAQAHPEAAADIGALGNVATVIPIFKGFGVLKEAAGATLAKALGKDALSSVIEDVAPKETAGSLAKGIAKRGTVKSLISGRISAVTDPAVKDLAETVVDNVPGFTKAKTLAEKIGLTQDTVSTMADDLKNQVEKTGANRIYSYRELNSYLNKLPRPTLLVGDMEKVYQKVIDKALEISRAQGGTISSLFDSRKLFDDFVSREFPNLYSSDSLTPMRTAIKNIRQGMNQFIEDRLPTGSGFRKSLRLQNKLLNAVDNMSKKAASGYTKEIGTTRLQRFGQRHPITSGLIKHTAKTALEGAGLAGGYGIYKNITGQ